MRDVLDTLERWAAGDVRAAVATVVAGERSVPRGPGATMAVAETGEIAGSVTGGCVEPAVVAHAQEVLAGAAPRVVTFGIADEDAYEVGLPCGGSVRILIAPMDPAVVVRVAAAVRDEAHLAVVTRLAGPDIGATAVHEGAEVPAEVDDLLRAGASGIVGDGDDERFVSSVVPRARMYVFGAIDYAAALCRAGRLLGYHVTVCDARAPFATRERFPDADDLVVEWPHRLIERSPIDERSVICVLTHDTKFDVPALLAALRTPAGYIGALGSRRTTERRNARLREEGLGAEDLARIHAPIGLAIGARTPEEVAVSIAAEIIATSRVAAPPAGVAR